MPPPSAPIGLTGGAPGLFGLVEPPTSAHQVGRRNSLGQLSGTAATIVGTVSANQGIAAGSLAVFVVSWASATDLVTGGSCTDSVGGNTWTIDQVGFGQQPGVAIISSVLTNALTPSATITLTLASGTPGGRQYMILDYGPGFTTKDTGGGSSATTGASSQAVTPSQVGDAVLFAVGYTGTVEPESEQIFNSPLVSYGHGHHTGTTTAYIAAADTLNSDVVAYTAKSFGGTKSSWAAVAYKAAPVTATPPLTQLVKVIDQTPFLAASRFDSQRRGRITAPPVQLAAAAAQTVVKFDAATQGGGLTFAHTCTGLNRFLTVGVAYSSLTVSVTGITYAGVALTRISRVNPALGAELWGLINPALGTNNVVITLSGATGTAQGAVSFTNANQTTQNGMSGGNFGTGDPKTSAAVTGPVGAMLVDMVADGSIVIQTGTQAWNDGGGDGQAYLQANGGAQNTSWTGGNFDWAIAVGVVLPAGPIVTAQRTSSFVSSPSRSIRQRIRGSIITSSVQARAASASQAATVSPLVEPVVVQAHGHQRSRRGSHVTANRWPGYQWAGLPPVTPLVEPQVVSQTSKTAERRSPDRRTLVVQNRWPGYQWVGLPPVNPLPKQVVQDQAAIYQELRGHRRSLIIQPGVQLAAATAGIIPPPVTPTKSVIVGQAVQRGQAEQNRERRTHVVANRWPGYQWVGLPPVTPLPRAGVILARPVTQRRQRVGHVIATRPVTQPIGPVVRPNVVHTNAPPTRRRRGGVQCPGLQRFATGVAPPPTTSSTHALYAYPSITATSAEAQSGGTGYLSGSSNSTPLPPSPGLAPNPTLAPQSDESIILNPAAAEPQTGASGLVTAGASGTVRI